ncbi:hypothetical protein [Streptomyces noursei]|uniref:hypothetical protein n=1 Tax=Streptomyces noursei TaxID=1971 RepID=UPI0019633631|nr:hypothetical protein [Streptomyces noursei]QRX92119.1 hypothetical protein JNO44_15765 [Streptomyces noursei]
MVVALSGINPAAAAEPQDFHVTYQSGTGSTTRNSYWVDITGTVTRIGDQYELSGVVRSRCHRDSGPNQSWSLAFGSSAESWRYVQRPCGESGMEQYNTEKITEAGPLRPDGRVYLQAGAYGGEGFGSWGWGTQRSVWV